MCEKNQPSSSCSSSTQPPLTTPDEYIPLVVPYIPSGTLTKIEEVLASGHLTEGSVTSQLENAFAAYVGARHAIAITSCTTGLEVVLRSLGIGAGDEVIVPGYTYPATAQAVMLTGAVAVITDVDAQTLNTDYDALEAAITPRTRALMPVSLFGNPLDWDKLNAMAKRHKLFIIEDAACGLGSAFRGQRTGSYGTVSVFSLHPRKSITTGEGGMITTNDNALAARLRSLKRFGLEKLEGEREGLRFVSLGTNLKMSDIVAAVGLAQMEEVDAIFAQRNLHVAKYTALLKDLIYGEEAIQLPKTTPHGTHGWQTYCVFLKKERRDGVLTALRAAGIEVQIGTYALHREPLFQTHSLCRIEGSTDGSQTTYETTLALPLYHTITEAQQTRVCAMLRAELLCASAC